MIIPILVIVAGVLWFAATNGEPVTLSLFLWELDATLAFTVGAAFILGFIVGVLWLAPSYWRRHVDASSSKRSLEAIKAERDALAERSKVLEEQMRELAPPHEGALSRS